MMIKMQLIICMVLFVPMSESTLMKDTEKYVQLKKNVLKKLVNAISAGQHEKLTMERNKNVVENENSLQNTVQLLLKGKVGFEFNQGLNGYCGTIINQKLRNRPQDFPPERWNLMSFQQPVVDEFDGPTTKASVTFRTVWLEKIAQIVVFHCYAKSNGDKVFKELHIDPYLPIKVHNGWKEYSVHSAFDDEHGRIGSVAVAYRYQRSIVYSTRTDYEAHLHVTLTDTSGQQKLNLCRYDGQRCCLQSLELNFEKEGFHLIHLPKVSTVYTCRGTCSYTHENDTRLAFESFLNGTRPQLGEPCCKPDGFENLSIIVKTIHPDIYKGLTLRDFSATSCSCQQ